MGRGQTVSNWEEMKEKWSAQGEKIKVYSLRVQAVSRWVLAAMAVNRLSKRKKGHPVPVENGAEGIQTYLPRPWPQISIPFNFYGKLEESQSFFLFALKKLITLMTFFLLRPDFLSQSNEFLEHSLLFNPNLWREVFLCHNIDALAHIHIL